MKSKPKKKKYKVPTLNEFMEFINSDLKAILREKFPDDFSNTDEQSFSA